MRSRGFALLETLVVMVILSILITIATFSFKEYYRRYRTEAQTRLLYGELQKARVDAICQRRTVRVRLYADRFEVYSSQADSDSGVKPLQTYRLQFAITCKPPWDPEVGRVVDFERDGLSNSNFATCLEDDTGAGAVDSIVIHTTRISIGKKDKGDECETDSITKK